MYIYICIYIYIERERHVCIYIYIYIVHKGGFSKGGFSNLCVSLVQL